MTMVDPHHPGSLTEQELLLMSNGQCPNEGCGHRGFRLGPRGGAAINIECCGCGARFNVVNFGWVIMLGHRLPKDD